MLIRSNTFSPMIRVVMACRQSIAVPLGFQGFSSATAFPATKSRLLLHSCSSRPYLYRANPVMISAALLTTQTNGSPTQAAASSLRSLSLLRPRQPTPLPNLFLPLRMTGNANLGALALFSSDGAPGRGGGKSRAGMLATAVTAGAVLFGKGKYILAALKLTKFASLGSMVLSVGAYSMIFGLPFAVGMVGLILVHETGHALVMMRYGIPFSPMVFLPFMGAVIAMKDQPRDAMQDAVIAFGGPALGTVGAMGLAFAAQATDSQLLYALADFGYMINLFNMLPIGSMDGGRILGACSPYAGVVGLGIGGGLIYYGQIYNPLFYLIMLAGGWSTFERFYDPAAHQVPNFYKITPLQKTGIAVAYTALLGTMFLGMSANAVNKRSPEELQRYQELSFDER